MKKNAWNITHTKGQAHYKYSDDDDDDDDVVQLTQLMPASATYT